MRPSEANWIAQQLASADDISPFLNIGSSTAEFRAVKQPHIEKLLFGPLRARGTAVIHSDLKQADGVDIAGDLFDPAVQARLREHRFKVVLGSNLLEHVRDRHEFARVMASLVSPGGLLIVTVPRSYPYHADPIDTGYRPSPTELAQLFPTFTPVRADTVADTTYGAELVAGGLRSVRKLIGALRPGDVGRARRDRLRWLFRPFTTSCVVLRAPN